MEIIVFDNLDRAIRKFVKGTSLLESELRLHRIAKKSEKKKYKMRLSEVRRKKFEARREGRYGRG
jgi:hypothetical protein